jgi:Rrf2 family protein
MTSTRFALGTHILVALAYNAGEPVRSAELATSVNTNATFIRQVLMQLRRAGLVRSRMGTGGGTLLARPADRIRLDEVYRATCSQPTIHLHHSRPNQNCPIGKNIQPMLSKALGRAEKALLQELHSITISDLAKQVQRA